jgi:hypothetical protein
MWVCLIECVCVCELCLNFSCVVVDTEEGGTNHTTLAQLSTVTLSTFACALDRM